VSVKRGPEALYPGLIERPATPVETTELPLELGPRLLFGALVIRTREIPQALAVRAPSALRIGVNLSRLISDSCQVSTPSLVGTWTMVPRQTVN